MKTDKQIKPLVVAPQPVPKKEHTNIKNLHGLFLAAFAGILFWCALSIARADVDLWDLRNSGAANALNTVACGNGICVAAGNEGTILTSADGVVWTRRTSGTAVILNSMEFANGMFVIVGESGTILTSTSGTSWTPRSSGTTDFLYDVSYGNGAFIAVSDTGTVLTSPNGITWTRRTGTPNVYGVAYGNGKFVAVGGYLDCFFFCVSYRVTGTSTDGVTWTQAAAVANTYLSDLAFGNGIFVAVGEAGTILTSTDGVSWTPRSSGSSDLLINVAFGDGKFVVVGGQGTILTSTDGVNWTPRNSGTINGLAGVGYGNGRFTAVGIAGTIVQSRYTPPPVLTIVQQPIAQSVSPGGNVTIIAAADGPNPPHYQWQFEGTNILNATNASYSVTNASLAHHGNYTVVVTDGTDTVISSSAFIYVLILPTIITPPVGVTNLQGQTVTFSVIATGAPPLNYRWARQGVTYLSNAPATLVITNIQPSLSGSFRVTVTNLAGSANSVSVNLLVIPDTDTDGLPDFWETNYFGNATSANATADVDGDGMSNRDEYIAGHQSNECVERIEADADDDEYGSAAIRGADEHRLHGAVSDESGIGGLEQHHEPQRELAGTNSASQRAESATGQRKVLSNRDAARAVNQPRAMNMA